VSNLRDMNDEPVQAASQETVRLLDHAVTGYARAVRDTRDRLTKVLESDPTCAMAHTLDGYLYMLSSKRDGMARARQALGRVVSSNAGRTSLPRREALHVAALDAWSSGDMRSAASVWDTLLDEHPRDLIALKVSQFVLSYLGESESRLSVSAMRGLLVEQWVCALRRPTSFEARCRSRG